MNLQVRDEHAKAAAQRASLAAALEAKRGPLAQVRAGCAYLIPLPLWAFSLFAGQVCSLLAQPFDWTQVT